MNHSADLKAGFTVALVALPLSIGIALASGAPASAGLIAAIIGGLIGSWSGGSYITINGPAAGLIVIVLDAITTFGQGDAHQGFRGMLAAAFVAAVLQMSFGFIKLARKGAAFPASVIHGMMAAIGLIILSKQVHILLGYTPHAKNPVMLFAEIPEAMMNAHTMIFMVGVISLGCILAWQKFAVTASKFVPAPLVGVLVGSGLSLYLGLNGKSLLDIPANVNQWIVFPDFSVMTTFAGWRAAITLALVGSLETILSASAVDKLDPQKRKTDLDRDLVSKGFCNLLSAAIGGLPMIAEIVRSSANASYGAKTWRANFFHGAFILVAVLALPTLLSQIPLSALAAILLVVGSRLGSPTHLKHAWKIGVDHFTGFMVTLAVTLVFDLLLGIIMGAVAQFLVEMYLGLKFKDLIHPHILKKTDSREEVNFVVDHALTFSNFLELKDDILGQLEKRKNITLSLEATEYVDHSVMEQLEELQNVFEAKGQRLQIKFSPEHQALGEDHLSSKKKAA